MATQPDVIRQYLDEFAARGGKVEQDGDNFTDYPVLINVLGDQRTLYVQDAKERYDGQEYHLEAILLFLGDENHPAQTFTIRKTCVAPSTCIVQWDKVHCATEIPQLGSAAAQA